MAKLDKQTRLLIAKMHQAFRKYPMLKDGDKIAVAVSGGHDSLSLLYLLHVRRPIVPEKYDLTAIHILGDVNGYEGYSPHQPLLDWLENSGIKYVLQPMILADNEKLPMNCYRCTWNRRSTLFRIVNRMGYNKIAFGHHFDDIVDTALLNLFYQGRIDTMYPYASYFGGSFSLIRPLMYITKKELDNFAASKGFPPPPPPCPNSDTSQRKAVADLLRNFGKGNINEIRRNIFRGVMECFELRKDDLVIDRKEKS